MRWAAEAIGAGSRIASMRRLTLGGWHANHALTVIDRRGVAHRVVLRRWARPEWSLEDPDFTAAAREVAVLELLAASSVPAPRLLAADPDGEVCDVPALLITHLPGHPPGLPKDMGPRANGQPAFGCYFSSPQTEIARAYGLLVLTLEGDQISAMAWFADSSVFPHFGLPRILR